MKIIECPRDAMQGLRDFIPTDQKIEYIIQLLKVGFDTIDFGSFVSPKAIPQMADTREVLDGLDLSASTSKLLAIVANVRGAEDALIFDEIDYLGYPLSVSETFQHRNTRRSINEALDDLSEIAELADGNEKDVVVYLSMGFGNPYSDPYSPELISEFIMKLDDLGISIISVADTVGTSDPQSIESLFSTIIPRFPHLEIGAHLHSNQNSAEAKINAAIVAGVRRLDGALLGYGGCPMAKDDLVGNIPTEVIISSLTKSHIPSEINQLEFQASLIMATRIFG